MAKYLTSVYVSGWQCSSTASTSNEPGPDVADYPYDTVPNKAWWNLDVRILVQPECSTAGKSVVPAAPRNNQVDQLFRAQLFHDRKQYEERRRMSPEDRAKAAPVDYLKLGKAEPLGAPLNGHLAMKYQDLMEGTIGETLGKSVNLWDVDNQMLGYLAFRL